MQREIQGTIERPELLILGRQHHPAKQVVVACNNPHKLHRTLVRERRRGALVDVTEIRQERPGVWAARAIQLKPIRPVWFRPALVAGGVLTGLTSLAAAGWALVSLLVGAAASLPAAGLIGAGALVMIFAGGALRGKSRRGGSEVAVDVSVRVRS
jgi:hypothetical protein